MALAIDIARYLIHLASPSEDEDVDCLCHLRLQKLLYYVQGWHLAVYSKPMFSGRIEAWTHGPVVREVYSSFADCRCHGIHPREGAETDALSTEEKEFVQSVWDEYKQYSASALRTMTHQEPPWREARGTTGPRERSDEEISQDAMRSFFVQKFDERVFQNDERIDKDLWKKARKDIESGRVQTTQEIRHELHRRRAGSNQG